MKHLLIITATLACLAASPLVTRADAQTSSAPSTTTKVENWTTKRWNAEKAIWARDKARWGDCRQLSIDQKLTGRKSWMFLYHCMT